MSFCYYISSDEPQTVTAHHRSRCFFSYLGAKYAIVVKTQKIRPTEGRFLLRFPFALRSGYSLLTAEDLISSLAMFFYIYFYESGRLHIPLTYTTVFLYQRRWQVRKRLHRCVIYQCTEVSLTYLLLLYFFFCLFPHLPTS